MLLFQVARSSHHPIAQKTNIFVLFEISSEYNVPVWLAYDLLWLRLSHKNIYATDNTMQQCISKTKGTLVIVMWCWTNITKYHSTHLSRDYVTWSYFMPLQKDAPSASQVLIESVLTWGGVLLDELIHQRRTHIGLNLTVYSSRPCAEAYLSYNSFV